MKSLKSILVASLGFFGLSAFLLTSSCVQDPCLDLNCQRGASCSDGFCQCPVGYEGATCEYTSASRFIGTYVGVSQCGTDPQQIDTAFITLEKDPDEVILRIGMGRTSLVRYWGKARTPEIQFYEDTDGETVAIYPSATVDNNQLTVYVETRVADGQQRSICKFVGNRID